MTAARGRTSPPKIDAAGGRDGRLRQPRARVVARRGPRVRVEERLQVRRLPAVSLSHRTTSARRGRRSPAICPNQPINVVCEDAKNPNLLFVGNDTGVFVSIDRGARWVKMNNNMPNMPVHDLLVHPREHDLILGSYGARHLHHEHRRAAGTDARRARGGRASVLDQADRAARHVVVRRERLPVRPASLCRRRTSRTAC